MNSGERSVRGSLRLNTFFTKYGNVTIYDNECYIGKEFMCGNFFEEDGLLRVGQYIDPKRNILEIGGHCGTSMIVYASFINKSNKIYVYEPQRKMYDLLIYNIYQNQLENMVIPTNKGVFCYSGIGKMNDTDLDGRNENGIIEYGSISKRYTDESNFLCNFGGACLGSDGEPVELITIDEMLDIDNIGFIHCDAQGSENYIFSKGVNTIAKYRPVIYYEDNKDNYLFQSVYSSYPQYQTESRFDIVDYCINELNYSKYIPNFHEINSLLVP